MITVYEKDGVLYIHRKGKQRIIRLGEDSDIVRSLLNKLHEERKIVYQNSLRKS